LAHRVQAVNGCEQQSELRAAAGQIVYPERANSHEGQMVQAVGTPRPMTQSEKRLLQIIRQKSFLKGQFKLASGAISDYYLDMKPTSFDPEGAALIGEIICRMLADDRDAKAIGGLELGAVPIVAAVCVRSWPDHPVSGFVVRKEKKGHGTDQKIDGNFTPGSKVVLIEDVTTKGGSVMQAVRAVRAQGAEIKRIITIVDRLEGAEGNLKKEGLVLSAIFTTADLRS
jgi:orotate phosphoribosyltransferase